MDKKGASSSRKPFYCPCCDVDLKTKTVYDSHIYGKKHKKNEKAAQGKNDAECSIFVSFSPGAGVKDKCLRSYFVGYGRIISLKVGPGHAFLKFDNRQSVKAALKKPIHQFKNVRFQVGKFQFKDFNQEIEEKQKKKEDEHFAIREMLNNMEDIPQQFSFMTEYLLLSRQDLFARKKICEELSMIFYPYFQSVTVHQFGSSINGYGMKGCDLDLFLDFNVDPETIAARPRDNKPTYPLPFKPKGVKTLPTTEMPLRQDHVSLMEDLDKVKFVCLILRRHSQIFRQLCVVPSKRCPLVKFVHHPSGLKCDLSLNNRKALYNSRLLRLYGQDPRVQQLVIAVRYWARAQRLTNPEGTTVLLTSYALTWLVLYYLIHRKPRVIPLVNELPAVLKNEGVHEETIDAHKCLHIPLYATLLRSENQESTAELLRGFFQFYASSVDWENQALSTWDGEMLPKQSLKGSPLYADCKVGIMTMLDPFVLSHNILGNVNERARIRFEAEVKKALEVTKKWTNIMNKTPQFDSEHGTKHWGLAEIFIPSPPDPEEPKKGGKRNKLQGEQKGGMFTINLHPPTQMLTSDEFVRRSEEMKMTPNAYWCSLVKKMVINVLETVYLIDVQETSVEEVCGHEEEKMKMGQKDVQGDRERMDVQDFIEEEDVKGKNEAGNVREEDEDVEEISEDESVEVKNEDEELFFVSSDDESKGEAVDEMMEPEAFCKQEIVRDDDEKENSDHYKSDACKRSVQKSNDTMSKKLKRDSEIKGVEVDCSEDGSESTAFSSVSNISDESKTSQEDSESNIIVKEKAYSDTSSTELGPTESDGNKKVQRLEAGEGLACSSSVMNEEKKSVPLPMSSKSSVTNSGKLKQNNAPEQRMTDTVINVVGNLKKITRISSYSCCTKHAMWLYRAQMKASLEEGNRSSLKGLELEQRVSNIVLKRLHKKKTTMSSSESVNTTSSITNLSSTSAGSNSTSTDLGKQTTGKECNTDRVGKKLESKADETLAKSQDVLVTHMVSNDKVIKSASSASDIKPEKDSKDTGNRGKTPPPAKEKGKLPPTAKAKGKSPPSTKGKSPSPSSKSKNPIENYEIPFECKIVECHAEGTQSLPTVSVVMHTDQTSRFRNIYSSASNVIIQLVASHLMDVDV